MEISSNDDRPESIGDDSRRCEFLSISIDDEDVHIAWDILVEVRRGEEGFACIANFRTLPVTQVMSFGGHNRLVGVCFCPGAVEWQVTCRPVTGTLQAGKDIRAELGLSVHECCGSVPAAATIYSILRGP